LSTLYLLVTWGLQRFMRHRERLESPMFTVFVFVHNVILSLGSATLLLAMFYEVYRDVQRGVPLDAFYCDLGGHSHLNTLRPGPYNFYMYVFYLSKFYEFIDTLVLVLKKKDLLFLHVYHHFITCILAYVSLSRHLDVSWLSAVTNLAVHTFMYYYYAVALLGSSPWWKKYLTEMQIAQFLVDLASGSVVFWAMVRTGGKCQGDMPAFIFAQLVMLSFLILFIQFFISAYSKRETKKGKHESAAVRKKQV